MAGHAHQQGRYLYAITDGAVDCELGKIGVDGATVYTVSEGPIAAVVSDIVNRRVRPERTRLAAHHGVVKRLMDEGAVLPVTFGTIAGSRKALSGILSDHKAAFVSQLSRVRGRVEMGLRVSWDVPNIFEYFVSRYRDLRSRRDELFGQPHGTSKQDKIELGQLFADLLAQERESHTESVIDGMSPFCAEIKRNKPRDERDVMRLACLIECDTQKRFEDGVLQAAGRFDNNFSFDFSGPWAPYNFVENFGPFAN